jgi:hypothetical protein
MDSAAEKRRRNLITDLSEKAFPDNKWVDITSINDISSRMMRAYVGVTSKTKMRDIGFLISMKLLQRDGNRVRPNTDIISAYLPRQLNAE